MRFVPATAVLALAAVAAAEPPVRAGFLGPEGERAWLILPATEHRAGVVCTFTALTGEVHHVLHLDRASTAVTAAGYTGQRFFIGQRDGLGFRIEGSRLVPDPLFERGVGNWTTAAFHEFNGYFGAADSQGHWIIWSQHGFVRSRLADMDGHGASAASFTNRPGSLLVGGVDGSIRLADYAKQSWLAILPGGCHAVTSIAVTIDDLRSISGDAAGALRVHDLPSGELLLTRTAHAGAVHHLSTLRPDDRLPVRETMRFVSAGGDGVVTIWNARTWSRMADLRGHDGPVYTAEYDLAGRRILTAGADGTVRVWDAESRGLLVTHHLGEMIP